MDFGDTFPGVHKEEAIICKLGVAMAAAAEACQTKPARFQYE
jgi:hypothetical protein